jgi:hypothetical protein
MYAQHAYYAHLNEESRAENAEKASEGDGNDHGGQQRRVIGKGDLIRAEYLHPSMKHVA